MGSRIKRIPTDYGSYAENCLNCSLLPGSDRCGKSIAIVSALQLETLGEGRILVAERRGKALATRFNC